MAVGGSDGEGLIEAGACATVVVGVAVGIDSIGPGAELRSGIPLLIALTQCTLSAPKRHWS